MRETRDKLFVSWEDIVRRTRVISGFLKQVEDENRELRIGVVGPKYGALPILTLLSNMQAQTSSYRLFVFPDCLDSSTAYLKQSEIVVIVDDVYDSGETTRVVERKVTKIVKPTAFLHAYLYIKDTKDVKADSYIGQRVCNKWIVFPWEPSKLNKGGRV